MESLYLLVPLLVALVFLIGWAFWRALQSGQFDDLERPGHDVIALGAPFFQRRFASMPWSILSPRRCIHWDGRKLCETPGVTRDAAPTDDTLEPLWRTYYAAIFNPARLKINAMLREMPRRYWANLPETDLIEKLIADATPRTAAMLAASHSKSSA